MGVGLYNPQTSFLISVILWSLKDNMIKKKLHMHTHIHITLEKISVKDINFTKMSPANPQYQLECLAEFFSLLTSK